MRWMQYFVVTSYGQVHRDNRCVYNAHVFFYVGCSDCVGVTGISELYTAIEHRGKVNQFVVMRKRLLLL